MAATDVQRRRQHRDRGFCAKHGEREPLVAWFVPGAVRMQRSWLACWMAIGAASLFTGCGTAESNLRTAFADTYACPESRVSVKPEGNDIYFASGCNKAARYRCGRRTSAIGCERQSE